MGNQSTCESIESIRKSQIEISHILGKSQYDKIPLAYHLRSRASEIESDMEKLSENMGCKNLVARSRYVQEFKDAEIREIEMNYEREMRSKHPIDRGW